VPKELSLKEHAADQLKRLKHIRGFPTERLALDDYVMALMVMETHEGVKSLMEDLTRTDWISCPTAAAIRTMAWERTEGLRKQRANCQECAGSGFRTVWILTTYHGMSLAPKKHERLRDVTNEEQAYAFARKVKAFLDENPKADKQMVVSAAEDCSCRKRVTVGA
jgi:uncharacterized protein YqkB